MPRIFCMIPTWNESENIGPLIDALLAADPGIETLVVDDNSPDGTWRIVAERARENPRVHLLHRVTDKGRGRAGIAGFKEALRLGADAVIEMDGDWSHDPKWIPDMLAAAMDADVVIGSRLVPGGGEAGRSPVRGLITFCANLYIRTVLGLKVRDATSGYRLFSGECVAALPWDAMRAQGPETVQEILLAAASRGFSIREVPIIFVERRHGVSTFNSKIMLRSLVQMWRLRLAPGELVPGKGHSVAPRIPAPVAIPASWAYGLARHADRALQLATRKRLDAPVFCVGNLTVGGTGKSPVVRLVAEWLLAQGLKPAVVSRGYGAAQKPTRPLVVSDGHEIFCGADQAGDEAADLARRAPGVAVVVHPDRFSAGALAIRMLGARAIVLDDGFQHERLARDADIVLWDLRDEPRRMRQLPAGRLREGLGALRRASAIVLTHGEYLPAGRRAAQTRRVLEQIKRRAPKAPVFETATGFDCAEILARSGFERAAEYAPWRGRKILAVSGLASPDGFETMLRADGADVVHHAKHQDHCNYTQADLDKWRALAARHGAAMIVTTSKDAVKIAALELDETIIVVAPLRVAITEPGRWDAFLKRQLESAARAR